MNNLIEKMTAKKVAIIMGIFIIVLWLIDYSPVGVARLLEITGGVGILDMETRYSADFAYNWLEAMGEAGRSFHLTRIMPLDIIFPPCLALMQFGVIAILMKYATKPGARIRSFAIAPAFYMVLDWLENIGITTMLMTFPSRLDTLAVATGWVTSVKKTVILVDIILIVVLLILLVVKNIRGFYAKTKG